MRLFRRRRPRHLLVAVAPNTLIVGEDLVRGFEDPGSPPTQADLDAVMGGASAVSVQRVAPEEEVLYETGDASELASLRAALRVEGEAGHCMCSGTFAFVFRRAGADPGAVTLHHGRSLRLPGFFLDARLVESDPILDWLSVRGMPEARAEYVDAQREAAESAHAVTRWRAAMPSALEPLWSSMREPSLEWPEVAEAMSRHYPEAVERARVLLEWFGHGDGPWSGYPMYEKVPEWCLLQMPLDVLIGAADAEPRTDALLEGAARLFACWSFGKERGHELARLPSELKRSLLAHSLASADEDKRARASSAFAE